MDVDRRFLKLALVVVCGVGLLSSWGCCCGQQHCRSTCGCGVVHGEGAVLEPIPAGGNAGCRGCCSRGRITAERDDAAEPRLAAAPKVLPPHSHFHPVPTRPVFSHRGPAVLLGVEVPPAKILRREPTPAHPRDLPLEPKLPADAEEGTQPEESALPDVVPTDDKPREFSGDDDVRFTDRDQAQLAPSSLRRSAPAAPPAVQPETAEQRAAIQHASVEWRPCRTRR